MAGGDELSARLPAAERVSLPDRLKQRAIIAFLTAEKIRQIQIHAILKTVYGDNCISVLMSVRFAVGRSAPLKPVMLLVMSNLVAAPAADVRSRHDQRAAQSADQLIRENRNISKESLATELNDSRTCAGDHQQWLGYRLQKSLCE